MTQISIPFLSQFREVMRSGQKTATSRTRRYGKTDDIFHIFGYEFRFSTVHKLKLSDVAATHWRQEGVNSPSEFMEIWLKLHRVWNPNLEVYVHHFKQVRELDREVQPKK